MQYIYKSLIPNVLFSRLLKCWVLKSMCAVLFLYEEALLQNGMYSQIIMERQKLLTRQNNVLQFLGGG